MNSQPRQTECLLCRGRDADAQLERVEVWRDTRWRLTVSLAAEVLGFAYLEPIRHIPGIAELDGEEAASLGGVLARVTAALKAETAADQVYLYVFGGSVDHLHIHLAPHREGDALNDRIIKGELVEEVVDGGFVRLVSKEFPILPAAAQERFAERLAQRLAP